MAVVTSVTDKRCCVYFTCTDVVKMSIDTTYGGRPSYGNHRENCLPTIVRRHVDVEAAQSHPNIADRLAPPGEQRLPAVTYERRERSYSTSDRRPISPSRTASSSSVSRFLSPDYGITLPSSGRGRPSTARRWAARRSGGRGSGGDVTTGGGGATAATMKRSSSATLVVDGDVGGRTASTSSFGSGLHLGSSVTFCNTFGQRSGAASSTAAAEHHELFDDNSNGPRRSCSITLAYPSDSVLLTTDDDDGHNDGGP